MYVVSLIVDDEVVATNHSHHPMRKTLRLAWELLGGIPQAECCVRCGGRVVAWLHTNHKGELDEADLHGPELFGRSLVTALNPRGPIFAGVFAQ